MMQTSKAKTYTSEKLGCTVERLKKYGKKKLSVCFDTDDADKLCSRKRIP